MDVSVGVSVSVGVGARACTSVCDVACLHSTFEQKEPMSCVHMCLFVTWRGWHMILCQERV